MRILQVGVGGMGKAWTTPLTANPAIEISGLVDVNTEILAEVAAQFDIPADRCYTDFDTALEHCACDAVALVTPPRFHAPHAIAAARAGKHVLTEKPIADTLENAKAMVAAADAAKVTLMVSQNYRRSQDAMSMRKLLDEGAIGPLAQLGHVSMEFYKAVNFGDTNFRTLMDYPLLIDMGIHHVDLLRYLTGADVVSVYARSFRPVWSWYIHEPGLAMTFELSNGAIGSYLGSWVSGGKETPWGGAWRLQGATGALLWDERGILLANNGDDDGKAQPLAEFPSQGIPRVIEEFVSAVAAGSEPMTSGRDNLKSIGIQFAALESIKRNAPVQLAELGI